MLGRNGSRNKKTITRFCGNPTGDNLSRLQVIDAKWRNCFFSLDLRKSFDKEKF